MRFFLMDMWWAYLALSFLSEVGQEGGIEKHVGLDNEWGMAQEFLM